MNQVITTKHVNRTREVMPEIKRLVLGRKIHIPDVSEKQNLNKGGFSIEGIGRGFQLGISTSKIFTEKCMTCLLEAGYFEHEIEANVSQESAIVKPHRQLTECRQIVGGIIPTIEFQTDETRIVLALSQGCRQQEIGAGEEKKMLLHPDAAVVPVRLEAGRGHLEPISGGHARNTLRTDSHVRFFESIGYSGFSSSEEAFKPFRRRDLSMFSDLPVSDVIFVDEIAPDNGLRQFVRDLQFIIEMPKDRECDELYGRVLNLFFAISSIVDLDPFLYIDIIEKATEKTTRYVIDGPKPLLFPDTFRLS